METLLGIAWVAFEQALLVTIFMTSLFGPMFLVRFLILKAVKG